jgi:hypothetical protein
MVGIAVVCRERFKFLCNEVQTVFRWTVANLEPPIFYKRDSTVLEKN